MKRPTRQFQLSDSEYAVIMLQPGDTPSEKLRHLLINGRVNDVINDSINDPINDKVNDAPKRTSKTDVIKVLRDALKRSKKVSPVKTELVAILTDILKDGTDDSEPPAIIPQPVVSDDDDGGIDPYILERAERLRAENAQQGLQPLGSAASPNMIARLARLSKKTEDEMKAMLDSQRKSERKHDDPEPSEDDWYPDEGE